MNEEYVIIDSEKENIWNKDMKKERNTLKGAKYRIIIMINYFLQQ